MYFYVDHEDDGGDRHKRCFPETVRRTIYTEAYRAEAAAEECRASAAEHADQETDGPGAWAPEEYRVAATTTRPDWSRRQVGH